MLVDWRHVCNLCRCGWPASMWRWEAWEEFRAEWVLVLCAGCIASRLQKKKRSRGPLSGFLQVNEAGTPRLVQHHGGLETEKTEETQKDKKTLTWDRVGASDLDPILFPQLYQIKSRFSQKTNNYHCRCSLFIYLLTFTLKTISLPRVLGVVTNQRSRWWGYLNCAHVQLLLCNTWLYKLKLKKSLFPWICFNFLQEFLAGES